MKLGCFDVVISILNRLGWDLFSYEIPHRKGIGFAVLVIVGFIWLIENNKFWWVVIGVGYCR